MKRIIAKFIVGGTILAFLGFIGYLFFLMFEKSGWRDILFMVGMIAFVIALIWALKVLDD